MAGKISYFEIKNEIVPSLIEDLRSLPDKSNITLEQLISDSNYADYSFSDENMFFLEKALYSQAAREKILLDHLPDGSLVVHNMSAKYICPNCGSVNTAYILWGYPCYTQQLKKKLASGAVHLGGCCVIPYGPDRYCNNCGNEFVTQAPGIHIFFMTPVREKQNLAIICLIIRFWLNRSPINSAIRRIKKSLSRLNIPLKVPLLSYLKESTWNTGLIIRFITKYPKNAGNGLSDSFIPA